jgi:prepilin-type N-terminal cleavage/methylation domain-containing protein
MRMKKYAQQRRGDGGFTLIELLVAIAILGVIIGGLGAVVIAYERNTNATTGRLSESHDTQIAAAYFSLDVESIGIRDWNATKSGFPLRQSVWVGAAASGGPYKCGASGTPLAVLAMDDPTSPNGPPRVVSYVVETVLGQQQQQLHRFQCVGSLAPSDVVLAHELDPTVPPTLTCSPSCDTPGVQSMTLTLTIRDANGHGQGVPSYVVKLTGQRRQT